jgi:hypothetical protein
MSNHSLLTPPSPNTGPEPAPLDWLLALLRKAIEGVMAEDQPVFKKANAIGRLGSLYMKVYGTAELERVKAGLEERGAEPEEGLSARGVETAADEAAGVGPARPKKKGSPASGQTGAAKPSNSPSPGKPDTKRHRPSKPGRGKKAAGSPSKGRARR